jgi:putative acetyltransferase
VLKRPEGGPTRERRAAPAVWAVLAYSPHMAAIRPETPDDRMAVRAVNRHAFGGDGEADLVERLRADGLVIASLVAVAGGKVIGHILFSALPIEIPEGDVRAAALAPMAVLPSHQRQGIGGALIRAGLAACRNAGIEAVVVLGHPDYYPRFGFSADAARKLHAPFSGPALMALELTRGVLAGGGRVRYPAAFGLEGD